MKLLSVNKLLTRGNITSSDSKSINYTGATEAIPEIKQPRSNDVSNTVKTLEPRCQSHKSHAKTEGSEPHLLTIPLEIRHRIYELLLDSECTILIMPPRPLKSKLDTLLKRGKNEILTENSPRSCARTPLGYLSHTRSQLRIEVDKWAFPLLCNKSSDPLDGMRNNGIPHYLYPPSLRRGVRLGLCSPQRGR